MRGLPGLHHRLQGREQYPSWLTGGAKIKKGHLLEQGDRRDERQISKSEYGTHPHALHAL
jgi:hypothetical protein